MSTSDISVITKANPTYPALLQESQNPPSRIFTRGLLSATDQPTINIVGSRRMTPYGKRVLEKIVPVLVQAGIGIVSGLAYGIDGEAHRIALKHKGRCVGVLGSGFEAIYPSQNRQLAEEILATGGCLLTEYDYEVKPEKYHFPERNRIVAALSPITLIIEAGEKSGTLITAKHAIDAGREVCIIPCDFFHPRSEGISILWKQGAQPIYRVEDLLAHYQKLPGIQIARELKPALTGTLAYLYDLISQGGYHLDQLLALSGLSVRKVQAALAILEVDGYIQLQENKWQRTS